MREQCSILTQWQYNYGRDYFIPGVPWYVQGGSGLCRKKKSEKLRNNKSV
jgi:hypothetical protein